MAEPFTYIPAAGEDQPTQVGGTNGTSIITLKTDDDGRLNATQSVSDGSTFQHVVQANQGDNTTGTGVPASGGMVWSVADGKWYRLAGTSSGAQSVAAAQSGAWTVTANAGTNLNTSTLALEAGGNLAAAAASLSVIDDWDESDRAKVNLIAGQVGVQGASGVVTALTQRVVLATDVALPTGANTIGTVTANAGTNLNTSLLALEAGGNLATAVASLSVMDDWDETDRCKVNLIAGQVGVQGASGVVTALTQRVVLATDVALPAGSNAIGVVDTELPAAVALSDTLSNPTTPLIGAANLLWNSGDSQWFRRLNVADANTTAGKGIAACGLMANSGSNSYKRLHTVEGTEGIASVSQYILATGQMCLNTADSTSRSWYNANSAKDTAGLNIPGIGPLGYVPSESKWFRLELRNQTTLNSEAQGYILPTALYAWNYDANNATAALTFTGVLDGTFSNARRLMTQADIVVYDGAQFRSVRGDTTGTLRAAPYGTSITNSAAVQAAAYAAADLAGGKRTWANAVRISGGSAKIKSILIGDQASNSAANSVYDLILFNSDPTGTTFTENSALDVADADLNKIIAVIRFDGVAGATLFANADNAVLYKQVDIPITLSATTTLYGALICRGGPTYAATTDVFITIHLEQF